MSDHWCGSKINDLEGRRPAVLVTGASRGIGLATARLLSERGFTVFAGVRSPDAPSDGLAALLAERSGRVIPLPLDLDVAVTHREAAAEIAGRVGPAGLRGLVNNAGLAVSGPLEFLPLDELRAQLETNLVGLLGVTQALLPQLRAARGRIVNISSIGGLVAGPILGPYHVSKFGLEALSDTLRRELRHLGVTVAVVEPGAIRTDIWATGVRRADELLAQLPAEGVGLYGHLLRKLRSDAASAAASGLEPGAVAATVHAALTARRPRARYLVGRDARIGRLATRLLPAGTVDKLLAPAPARDAGAADPARRSIRLRRSRELRS